MLPLLNKSQYCEFEFNKNSMTKLSFNDINSIRKIIYPTKLL